MKHQSRPLVPSSHSGRILWSNFFPTVHNARSLSKVSRLLTNTSPPFSEATTDESTDDLLKLAENILPKSNAAPGIQAQQKEVSNHYRTQPTTGSVKPDLQPHQSRRNIGSDTVTCVTWRSPNLLGLVANCSRLTAREKHASRYVEREDLPPPLAGGAHEEGRATWGRRPAISGREVRRGHWGWVCQAGGRRLIEQGTWILSRLHLPCVYGILFGFVRKSCLH